MEVVSKVLFCKIVYDFDYKNNASIIWSRPEINIEPWRIASKDIHEGSKILKWKDRVPYAYWRGNPLVAPWRKEFLKCNATATTDWNVRIYSQVSFLKTEILLCHILIFINNDLTLINNDNCCEKIAEIVIYDWSGIRDHGRSGISP